MYALLAVTAVTSLSAIYFVVRYKGRLFKMVHYVINIITMYAMTVLLNFKHFCHLNRHLFSVSPFCPHLRGAATHYCMARHGQ